jgi:hypothetical protein
MHTVTMSVSLCVFRALHWGIAMILMKLMAKTTPLSGSFNIDGTFYDYK